MSRPRRGWPYHDEDAAPLPEGDRVPAPVPNEWVTLALIMLNFVVPWNFAFSSGIVPDGLEQMANWEQSNDDDSDEMAAAMRASRQAEDSNDDEPHPDASSSRM